MSLNRRLPPWFPTRTHDVKVLVGPTRKVRACTYFGGFPVYQELTLSAAVRHYARALLKNTVNSAVATGRTIPQAKNPTAAIGLPSTNASAVTRPRTP